MVRPGDVVVILPRAIHRIRNLSNKEVILLVTCAPAWTPGCEVRAGSRGKEVCYQVG
jgi:mannose-6-phosphate isomerase-like protein (cupin superfamily)